MLSPQKLIGAFQEACMISKTLEHAGPTESEKETLVFVYNHWHHILPHIPQDTFTRRLFEFRAAVHRSLQLDEEPT